MKIKPRIAVLASIILLCIVGVLVSVLTPHEAPNSESKTAELSGYYQNSSGIMDVNTRDMIVSGEFSEVVANKDYLLTNDKEGTLTLTRISDKKTIKIDESKHSYQLKTIGDDFGYLQQRGEDQYITFLNPENGTSTPLKTEHSVITWDAIGSDIAYHLYDTTTIGFAKYDNNLGVKERTEIDGNIETIGQMFSDTGKNYVWVVANQTENLIYSVETHQPVTSNFPVVKKMAQENGTLAEIAGNCWIVTAPVDGSGKLFSQIWDKQGELVLNMGVTGYTFSGDAAQGNGFVYLPVSYTNGNTPDGLLVMNSTDNTTDFEDKLHAYIPE